MKCDVRNCATSETDVKRVRFAVSTTQLGSFHATCLLCKNCRHKGYAARATTGTVTMLMTIDD